VIGALLGRSVVRRLAWPPGVRVVGVGGTTFGGSGKTPLAIACAAELAARGARVALVGHAYRARPGRPRVVSAGDPLREVGDEALVAARALEPLGVRVVVAPTRACAIALASREADTLVVDGVLQSAPVRVSLALLAADAAEPWGRRKAVPPLGYLRAPAEALLGACDMVITVGDGGRATLISEGAWIGGTLHPWRALATRRLGLVCALARPERVVRFLAGRGIRPHALLCCRDHGPLGRRTIARAARARVDLWLATPKCALHVAAEAPGLPLATIDHALALPPGLRAGLAALAPVP